MKIAIIGTAGRDKSKIMSFYTWMWMTQEARKWLAANVPGHAHLVSGGAAWADHVAVNLFLCGHAQELTLHLPAPLDNTHYFEGGKGTAGSAANYYHSLFSNIAGIYSREEVAQAARHPMCHGSVQPVKKGYQAMFARNALVAKELDPKVDAMLAFTFGQGDEPEDGGTKNTWDQFEGAKYHFTIPEIQ